MVKIKRKKT